MVKESKKNPTDNGVDDKKNINIILNHALNSLWIDNFNFGTRPDGICFLRFLAAVPEGITEQARIMTSRQHLISLIDLLCLNLDYYPEKVPQALTEKAMSKKPGKPRK